jgi:hypothetical protein
MDPRDVLAGEATDEPGSRGGARRAARVLQVGHVGVVGSVVVLPHRHIEHALGLAVTGLDDELGKVIVVAEGTAGDVANHHAHGTGQGGQVDDAGGALQLGVLDGVSQRQATFSVGVVHFHGETVDGVKHVTGLEGRAAGHVLGGSHDSTHLDVETERCDGPDGSHGDSAAAHVTLHVTHAVGRLDIEAAGVERHRLADDGQLAVRLAALGRVEHVDQVGRLVGAKGDGQEGTGAELLELLLVEHLGDDGATAFAGDLLAEVSQAPRGAGASRLVGEVAGEVDALSDVEAVLEALAHVDERGQRPPPDAAS